MTLHEIFAIGNFTKEILKWEIIVMGYFSQFVREKGVK